MESKPISLGKPASVPHPGLRRLWRMLEPAFFIAPAFLVLFIILVYPLGYSFWLSFHEWTLYNFRTAIPFVGLDNYIQLLTNGEFVHSVGITLGFMAGAISLEFILGMALALLLNHDLRAKGIIRSLILLPMMVTNVVIGLTFRLLFNYQFGLINYYLGVIGIEPLQWLSSTTMAMPAIIIVDVWNTTSFVTLMLLAGLQSLPEEPFEAARIDGASAWQSFRYLILPLLRPTILVALLWRIIDTFRIFDVVYLLTAGGPARATETVSLFVYRNGFQLFNLGYASAASYLMILGMLIMSVVVTRLIRREA
jgi:multiple sugar transport system permease protein